MANCVFTDQSGGISCFAGDVTFSSDRAASLRHKRHGEFPASPRYTPEPPLLSPSRSREYIFNYTKDTVLTYRNPRPYMDIATIRTLSRRLSRARNLPSRPTPQRNHLRPLQMARRLGLQQTAHPPGANHRPVPRKRHDVVGPREIPAREEFPHVAPCAGGGHE